MLTHGSVFSGLGGGDLAAQRVGWTNLFHCEIIPFCQQILKYYWPDATTYTDIKQTDFTVWRGKIDVLSGGFPCQPYSAAGQRRGTADNRHLWPEMFRAIREIRPRYVVGENVRGFITWSDGLVFDEALADLESEGYEVLPFLLPAVGCNAPHERYRVWIIAYAADGGRQRTGQGAAPENGEPGPEQSGIMEGRSEGLRTRGAAPDSDEFHDDLSGYGAGQIQQQEPPELFRHNTANADRSGFQTQRTGKQTARPEQYGKLGTYDDTDTGNTGNTGLQRSQQHGASEAVGHTKSPWSTAEFCKTQDWSEFPTQSPVCGRNDEFPGFVDTASFFRSLGIEHPRQPAIATSKWFAESLKGYGNAWVPELAIKIFTAIDTMEKYHNNER